MKPEQQVSDSTFVVRHLGQRLAAGGEFGEIIGELRSVCAPSLSALLDQLEQGWQQGGLSGALAAAPKQFGSELSALVRCAEEGGGDPAPLLAAFAERLERMGGGLRLVQETLVSFGSYFAVLLLLGLLIYNLLVIFVAPAFEMLFVDMGSQLPALTRIYLAFGDWLWLFDLVLLGLLVQLYLTNYRLRRSLALGERLSGWVWRLPLLRSIAGLYRAGFLLHAMQLLQAAGLKDEQLLEQGAELAQLLPATHTELVAAAHLGRLSEELQWQTSLRDSRFEREVRDRARRLSIALYILIALFFGGMVIAFYAPLFAVASAI